MAGDKEKADFVVVANRLPVDQHQGRGGRTTWQRSPGGLVAALEPVMRQHDGVWIGWAGSPGAAPSPFRADGLRLHPVRLSNEDIVDYYEGFANSTLWPLYHDAVAAPQYHRHWWDRYLAVNERFAKATAAVASEDATIWIQDYQLQLVPGMLRKLRPDLRIGFFLHIPFPPVELFMQLPWRKQIVTGLLGADLIGFQRPEAAANFLRLASYLERLPRGRGAVTIDGRVVAARSFPISIDTAALSTLAESPRVQERAARIRSELGNPKNILLGVDRLDYTKGIDKRLKAFRELLRYGQISVPHTVLVQVATPSRERVEHYQELREDIEREVGRVNGEFGKVGVAAVHYLRQNYDKAELCALYSVADVMLVTPLRDGMNLVAKEYVASRPDLGGALVLSEFTGAAEELTGPFLVNPHDVDGLKRGIMSALTVKPEEGQRRIASMRSYLMEHDVARWANEFLAALAKPLPQPAAHELIIPAVPNDAVPPTPEIVRQMLSG